jgi:flagellar biogenesis protein FliO
MPQTLWFFIAFLIVLALIGLAAWLVRRFGGNSLGSNAGRGRMPRLAVIDAAAVDGRRRLVLVRRDNVEHLLMIGGPTDIVVEPNIVRSQPQRDQVPARSPAGTELPPPARVAPDAGWSEPELPRAESFDHREPALPELPPRPSRGPYADEVRRPAAPVAADPLSSFAPEPMVRPEPILRSEPPRAIPRSERSEPIPPRMPRASELPPKAPPPIRPQRPAAPEASADQNLADMAQRLEAALRRPGGEPRFDAGEARTPPTAPAMPSVAPDQAPSRPLPRPESAPRTAGPAAPPPPPPPAKAPFENLEDEMASLLGRPKPPA